MFVADDERLSDVRELSIDILGPALDQNDNSSARSTSSAEELDTSIRSIGRLPRSLRHQARLSRQMRRCRPCTHAIDVCHRTGFSP